MKIAKTIDIMSKKNIMIMIASGLAVGFINGFFGGGGGLIVVPLLTYVLKLPVKKAHATAIMIILPITIASAIMYFFGMEFDLLRTVYVSAGSVAGGIVGALLLKKCSNNFLRVLFAAVMLAAGIRMIF